MERVVLIEADMRRPGISNSLPSGRTGLSDYLSGSCESEDIQERIAGGMYFIPAGSEPYDPLELLSSGRFERLIRNLAAEYDRVIIDTAPIGAVSDALVISKLADVAVFVVKADSTQVEDVEISINRLRQVGVNVAGSVITQVDMSKVVSYGGQYRYRGYYDPYGYSRPSRKNPRFNTPAARA
jgi:capsular exopolysaccharide synthesis family protein